MAVTIGDYVMTSDQHPHSARQAPGADHQWEVSWLPGRRLTRNQAITAMTLAEATSPDDAGQQEQLRPFIQGWAGELGLTADQAVTQIAATRDLGRRRRTRARAARPRGRRMSEPLAHARGRNESRTRTSAHSRQPPTCRRGRHTPVRLPQRNPRCRRPVRNRPAAHRAAKHPARQPRRPPDPRAETGNPRA